MAEQPQRYCSNCGHELSPEDQFCPNCGTPVHQAARVPTPEADVSVPPPPQAGGAGAAAPGQPAQEPSAQQPGFGRRHPILTGCLGIIVLFVVVIILDASLSGGGGDETAGGAGGGGGGGAGGNEPAQDQGQGQNQGQNQGQGQQQGQPEQEGAGAYTLGEEANVGDVSYTVTDAELVKRLEDPTGFEPPLTGNFVVVTFTFANNGDEPVTVSDLGLYLYDDQGRQYETDTDAAIYLPQDKSLYLLDRVNPGLSKEIQTVYSVPPDANGFELEVSSGFFATETARIALGF